MPLIHHRRMYLRHSFSTWNKNIKYLVIANSKSNCFNRIIFASTFNGYQYIWQISVHLTDIGTFDRYRNIWQISEHLTDVGKEHLTDIGTFDRYRNIQQISVHFTDISTFYWYQYILLMEIRITIIRDIIFFSTSF